MSVRNLAATFEDKERVPKIQGLINRKHPVTAVWTCAW
jgi:hypothetical protein